MGKSILDYQNANSVLIEYSKFLNKDLETYKRVLLTEGKSDVKVWLPVLSENDKIYVRSMGGRERLLKAAPEINKEFSHKVHFLVDCDGKAINGIHPDSSNYITLSKYRDIEADIIFDTLVIRDLIIEYSEYDQKKDLLKESRNLAVELINKASSVCVNFGMIIHAASAIGGIKMSIPDKNSKKGKRRIRIDEIQSFNNFIENQELSLTCEDIVSDLEIIFKKEWVNSTKNKILDSIEKIRNVRCKRHESANCIECNIMNFVNGHDLVTVLSWLLSKIIPSGVSAKELDSDIRKAFGKAALDSLDCYSRIMDGYKM